MDLKDWKRWALIWVLLVSVWQPVQIQAQATDIKIDYPLLADTWVDFIYSNGNGFVVPKCRGLVNAGLMDSLIVRGQVHFRMVFPLTRFWFGSPTFEARRIKHDDLVFLAGNDLAVFENGAAIDPDTINYITVEINRETLRVTTTQDRRVKRSKGAPNQPPGITGRGAFISRQKRQDGRGRR